MELKINTDDPAVVLEGSRTMVCFFCLPEGTDEMALQMAYDAVPEPKMIWLHMMCDLGGNAFLQSLVLSDEELGAYVQEKYSGWNLIANRSKGIIPTAQHRVLNLACLTVENPFRLYDSSKQKEATSALQSAMKVIISVVRQGSSRRDYVESLTKLSDVMTEWASLGATDSDSASAVVDYVGALLHNEFKDEADYYIDIARHHFGV